MLDRVKNCGMLTILYKILCNLFFRTFYKAIKLFCIIIIFQVLGSRYKINNKFRMSTNSQHNIINYIYGYQKKIEPFAPVIVTIILHL